MRCDCASEVSKKLKEHRGEELVLAVFLDGSPSLPVLETYRDGDRKKRGRLTLTPNFCPFCGKDTRVPTGSRS